MSTAISPPLALPRHVPVERVRKPKENIPQTKLERHMLLRAVRRFVAESAAVPPVPMTELREMADAFLTQTKTDPMYRDYVGVLINNELWREGLAAIPYERRLLLLPKCLRVEEKCPAPFDEFGLLCKQCGLCSIQDLQIEAERLGYAVLVAEGSAIVMAMIQTGKIEAIVGVSCLSVLEKAFPYMEAAAIPGIAIPLLQDDCINTTVDLDWVWDVIHLTRDDNTRRLDLTALREEIQSWFTHATLNAIMGAAESDAERIAREWLLRAGKRWRPFLTVAAFQALRDDPTAPIPNDLRKIAVSVECFHKASLIHDDIEDGDATRYGEKTLHEEHGVASALNVGDLLIGEGYRLIGASSISSEQRAQMLAVAAEGHCRLCRGQGAELAWMRQPQPLTQLQVLDIFRQKTAPAFEVALQLGAIYANRFKEVRDVLAAYSEALGIAYQIRDDLSDAETDRGRGEPLPCRSGSENPEARGARPHLRPSLLTATAPDRARVLLESYKEEAIRSLREVDNANLKGLLRRVIGKIFNETEIQGWCHEFEARNASSRAARPEAVG